MQQLEGNLLATDLKLAIVVSRFNEFITESLLKGAVDTIVQHGGKAENLTIVKVPGAFEIPVAAKRLALSQQFAAIVCLGAVIRGATPHFDYVCSGAASGIAAVALETGVPIAFGILTTDSIEQALERAGTKAGNKGRDAALSAIEMANLFKKISVA